MSNPQKTLQERIPISNEKSERNNFKVFTSLLGHFLPINSTENCSGRKIRQWNKKYQEENKFIFLIVFVMRKKFYQRGNIILEKNITRNKTASLSQKMLLTKYDEQQQPPVLIIQTSKTDKNSIDLRPSMQPTHIGTSKQSIKIMEYFYHTTPANIKNAYTYPIHAGSPCCIDCRK